MEHEVSPKERFVPGILPWLLGAAGLLVYLLTVNRWVSFSNLVSVSRVAGLTSQPDLSGPLYWLVTYPFRWLPGAIMPLALNVFSAVCGALTLALLARSVALLPHDRTHEQRERERSPSSLLSVPNAWLPPVLAVLVCGLQLSFWEHATSAAAAPPLSASSEIFDLLLFAYVIRCVLEYRIDERDSWLTRASFVYALAMTNNWAMIGFFPLFIGALVWIRGMSFFDARFLTRMFFAGALGLSLYLVLPVVQSFASYAQVPFWEGFKTILGGQKTVLYTMIKGSRKLLLLLSLTSILPVIFIGIRWASFSGDVSRAGTSTARLMFQVIHGLFLVACAWVALDPPFSPRNQSGSAPFLTFYYLGALSVGYFSGYFLLMAEGRVSRWRRPPGLMRFTSQSMALLVWVLLVIVPFIQVYKNLEQIREFNGPTFERYGSFLMRSLPDNAVVLSDDSRRLALADLAARRAGRDGNYLFVDTQSLPNLDYHRYLRSRYGDRWPLFFSKEVQGSLQAPQLQQLSMALAITNSLYYLNPSFGYYFEVFYPEPHGLAYKLSFYPTNSLLPPPISKEIFELNQQFWKDADRTAVKPLEEILTGKQADKPLDRLMDRAHFKKGLKLNALVLGHLYSPTLNYWGTELQKAGDLTNACAYFESAKGLNPYNVVARINLECNKSLRDGHPPSSEIPKAIEDDMLRYRDWDQVVSVNGPFDHPTYNYEQGRSLVKGRNIRQAAQQFARAKELAPDNIAARLWLAELYVNQQWPDAALREIKEIQTNSDLLLRAGTNRSELLLIEASAHLIKGDVESADGAVQAALKKNPSDTNLLETAVQTYFNFHQYSNALPIVRKQISITPEDPSALMNLGFVCLQLKDYETAIPALNRVITAQATNYAAVLNRAIACLQTEKLEQAQRDYELLAQVYTNAFQVYFGLGEIAYRQKNKEAAIRNYELYLSKEPPPEEARKVSERLKELYSGSL